MSGPQKFCLCENLLQLPSLILSLISGDPPSRQDEQQFLGQSHSEEPRPLAGHADPCQEQAHPTDCKSVWVSLRTLSSVTALEWQLVLD